MLTLRLMLLCGSLAFAPIPFPQSEPTNTDLKKIQGTWRMVVEKCGGISIPCSGWHVTIVGRRLTYIDPATGKRIECSIVINAKPTPKQLDLTNGKLFPSIYSLQGNRLMITYGQPGAERPDQFDTSSLMHYSIVLERMKN
jgi:uncharacterized protein (TIGR03067 family)